MITYIGGIIVALFFIGGAIFTGYFADAAYLTMNAALYLGLLGVVILRKRLIFHWLHAPILVIVLGYWLTCLHAVDLEVAVLEASRVSSLLPIALLASLLSREKLMQMLSYWPWAGAFMTIIGVMFQLERNGRLESTLQYANALAIVCLTGLLVSMLNYAGKQSRLSLVLLTVNAAGLLLTFSRSVWVLWLLSAAVLVLVIPQLRKMSSIIYLSAGHLAGVLIAMLIKQDALFFLNRVSSIQTNTAEFQIRLVYWKDSIAIIRDYWWGGTGGGGWTVLQNSYQSQPYYVKFIHNHYIQILLDIGVLGGLSLLTLIGLFYFGAFKRLKGCSGLESNAVRGLLIIVTVLLLHAGFDFDLTYPLLFALLICFMLAAVSQGRDVSIGAVAKASTVAAAAVISVFFIWLGIAYQWKEQGVRAVRANELQSALGYLAKAEQALPWSSSILYETAKLYVHMGNQSGDLAHYRAAEAKLTEAAGKVQGKAVYEELLEAVKDRLSN